MSESWVFRVEAHPEESLGHYLGRFRRLNHLSHRILASHLGIRVDWVVAWESPSRRRNPTSLQVIALAKLFGLAPEQVSAMFPPVPLHLQTRLCAACYRESSVHRSRWQQAGIDQCESHHLDLLSDCPVCGTCFRTPALWSDDRCEQCGFTFRQMLIFQLLLHYQWRPSD